MSETRNLRSDETASSLPSASRWSWITFTLLLVVGAVVGFIVGRFGAPALALKYEATWDIVDVLTLLVTIVIALYVEHAVTSSSEVARERKRFLADLVRQALAEWADLHRLFRQERPDQLLVASAIRTIDISVIEVRDAFAMCRVSVAPARLETTWLQYRRALENFPEPLTSTEQALLQKFFVDGRKCANWLQLALPTS
jgi:hypothetical protein